MASTANKPPVWFWIVAVVLLLWGLMGLFACIQQFRLGAEAMGPPTDYDRALYASLPAWYNWVYLIAVGAGAAGSLSLLLRKAVARPLYVVSLVFVVLQFGWLFGTTDMLTAKGMWTAYFPIFIVLVALFQIWLATTAIKRGWIA